MCFLSPLNPRSANRHFDLSSENACKKERVLAFRVTQKDGGCSVSQRIDDGLVSKMLKMHYYRIYSISKGFVAMVHFCL